MTRSRGPQGGAWLGYQERPSVPEERVKEARGKLGHHGGAGAERTEQWERTERERARHGIKSWLCYSGRGERTRGLKSLETFLGHAVRLVGSQVPDEGLNPGHDGQGAKSEPPGHQGRPPHWVLAHQSNLQCLEQPLTHKQTPHHQHPPTHFLSRICYVEWGKGQWCSQ